MTMLETTENLDSAEQVGKSIFADEALQGLSRDSSGTSKRNGRISSGSAAPKHQPSSRLSQQNWTTQKLRTAKVKQTELILFTTQLSVMLDSGVVLSDALDAIAEQAEQGAFKMIIMDVSEMVKGGDNFSKALVVYPKVFNSMFISMVEASEASGRMAEMLSVLSGYLNFEAETRKRVKGALTYPFIMALMAVAATGTLMFFVLPRFMGIYEAKGAALPKITQILVGFSKMLGDLQTMTTALTVMVLVSIGLYYWACTVSGRRIIDFMKIRMPVLGTMFVDMIVTRSMRIMATMVNTGVSLLEAIEVIEGASSNYYFRRLWVGTDKKIRDGYQLSESIQISQGGEELRTELIEPGIIQMIRAGEKSGKLGEVCDKISTFYEKKLEASIKHVTALIEPIMITVLGAIIGTIAIALLLPVFRISTVIAH
ncbi:MAG: type II secretion system F family protein [Planctomycetota bacterium]|jgi:type IV pilus assembly protein PilC